MADRREVLLPAAEIARRVEAAADAVAPGIDDRSVVVCLLTGGLWFAADLMRALARRGRDPGFDCLWLASYGEARESAGRVEVRAGLQRPVSGRTVWLVDDVIDSGLSLQVAREMMFEAGAATVRVAVFARKPWPEPRAVEPDVVAWEAPARFLAGYGMDLGGHARGLPDVVAGD